MKFGTERFSNRTTNFRGNGLRAGGQIGDFQKRESREASAFGMPGPRFRGDAGENRLGFSFAHLRCG